MIVALAVYETTLIWHLVNNPKRLTGRSPELNMHSTCMLQAQAVCCFEDHELWYPDNHQPLYLSNSWVISYCRVGAWQTC